MSNGASRSLTEREPERRTTGSDWSPEIMEDLHALLSRLETRRDTLGADVRNLERDHGTAVYTALLHLLSHLRFPADEAKPHWERILEHQRSMQQQLGSAVDLRVALVSYFVQVNRQLKNPKIIEMQLFERERASAYRDELTGLYNYRMFREHLERELYRSRRSGQPLSLVMIDVDDFKSYNDANGHEAGNQALEIVAGVLEGALRKSDVAARYGGEEFALILPSTPKSNAQLVAERTREAIEQQQFENEDVLPGGGLTVSLGVATFPADAADPPELVRHADRALYVAKAAGRNQVVLYGQSHRSYGRADVQMSGTFRTLTGECSTLTTVNVSEAGILFRTEKQLQAGSLVELSVDIDAERRITASGRIVHVEDAGDGTYRTALHITEARNADRARLMRLVRESAVADFPSTDASSKPLS